MAEKAEAYGHLLEGFDSHTFAGDPHLMRGTHVKLDEGVTLAYATASCKRNDENRYGR